MSGYQVACDQPVGWSNSRVWRSSYPQSLQQLQRSGQGGTVGDGCRELPEPGPGSIIMITFWLCDFLKLLSLSASVFWSLGEWEEFQLFRSISLRNVWLYFLHQHLSTYTGICGHVFLERLRTDFPLPAVLTSTWKTAVFFLPGCICHLPYWKQELRL